MGGIEWAMWANEQALVSSAILFIGAICGVAGQYRFWQCAAFALAASVLIFLVEYPRGKRQRGTTVERRFQGIVSPVIKKLGPVTTNYYARFVFHLLLCIPCCFSLSTVFGGVCLICTSIIYFVAAIKGEEWKAVEEKQPTSQLPPASEPPKRPPPRLNPGQGGFNGVAEIPVTHNQV